MSLQVHTTLVMQVNAGFLRIKQKYKLGLSWAKLSISWDCILLKLICIKQVVASG